MTDFASQTAPVVNKCMSYFSFSGPALGGHTRFKGLGIFFDTYNNQQGNEVIRSFPYISAMISNGEDEYDPTTDGAKTQLEGCHVAFRNKDTSTFAVIRYSNNTLEVSF